MGEETRAAIQAAANAAMDDLLRMWRADAEQLAAVIDLRVVEGSATEEERAALVQHQNLKALT